MAGGTFTAQNKIRPGAYINFKTNKKPIPKIGTRGIVAMSLPLTWGDDTDSIPITHRDFEKNGQGLFAKTGLSATGEESLPIRLALQNANKVLLFRNNGGIDLGERLERACGEFTLSGGLGEGKIIVEAKYAGTLGNRIQVQIFKPNIDGVDSRARYVDTIYTDEDGKETILDSQRINDHKSGSKPLRDNDFVTFTFTEGYDCDDIPDDPIIINLEGGEDGEVPEYEAVSKELLSKHEWNVYAGDLGHFIKDFRENEGKKVQNVVAWKYFVEVPNPNYEGTIYITQGIITKDGTEISKELFVAYIAGMTAGAEINQSNTYHVIEEAADILEDKIGVNQVWETGYTMEEALQNGAMMLSRRQDGAIVIEKDINSLHTFEGDNQYKDYSFTKNRVIRTLDEINNSTKLLFEKSYIGKVDNTEEGRNIFKADLINYLKLLQSMNCIQNFDAGADIEILAGNEIDELVVNLSIQPVDSMEKLYMTVTVG